MMNKKCPQCKSNVDKVQFDIGDGIKIDSLHCKKCGFNITPQNKVQEAIASKSKLAKKDVAELGKLVKKGIAKAHGL